MIKNFFNWMEYCRCVVEAVIYLGDFDDDFDNDFD